MHHIAPATQDKDTLRGLNRKNMIESRTKLVILAYTLCLSNLKHAKFVCGQTEWQRVTHNCVQDITKYRQKHAKFVCGPTESQRVMHNCVLDITKYRQTIHQIKINLAT